MNSQEINFIEASYTISYTLYSILPIVFFISLMIFFVSLDLENKVGRILRIPFGIISATSFIIFLVPVIFMPTKLHSGLPIGLKTYTTAEEYTHLTTDELKDLTYDPEVMTDIIQDHGFDGWAKYRGKDWFSPVSKDNRPNEIIPDIVNDEVASKVYSHDTYQIYLYTSKNGCNQYYQITELHGTPKDSFGRSYWNGKVTIEPYQEICSEE